MSSFSCLSILDWRFKKVFSMVTWHSRDVIEYIDRVEVKYSYVSLTFLLCMFPGYFFFDRSKTMYLSFYIVQYCNMKIGLA